MKITTTRSTGSSESKQQMIRLPGGWYGGMLANYSEPFQRQNTYTNEMEEKMVVSFLITHGINEQRLPHFGEAVRSMPLKMFYDPKKNLKSKLFEFYCALLSSGKNAMTPEQIIALKDDELPDLDNLIGYPAAVLLEPTRNTNASGVYRDNIKDFMPASPGMRKAIGDIYKNIAQFEVGKNGLRFLKFPCPTPAEDVKGNAQSVMSGVHDDASPF